MPRGLPQIPSERIVEKALATLARAGCGPEEVRLIVGQVDRECTTGTAWAARIADIAAFARSIGPPAAHDYFRAIGETKAVAELTAPRLWEFAGSVDRHTAEWYFWAIWGTGAVAELTSDRVLRAIEFFRSIDSPATVEYFLAIRETKAVAELTDERVLDTAVAIGSDAAFELFGACWETGAPGPLTTAAVLDYARSAGAEVAREYFRAIRETKAVAALTDEAVLGLARSLGGVAARELFRAVRETKAAATLTAAPVLRFAGEIGAAAAVEYFRTLSSTNAVARLTAPRILGAGGVLRSIGPEASLDYFLAAATTEGAPAVPAPAGREPTSVPEVPVLTLLDLPSYERYRPLGLAGASVAFWAGVWRTAVPVPAGAGGVPTLALALSAWGAVLVSGYLLLGALATHASEQFLARRRRLLNEHGIRWHDCLAKGRACDVCWGPGGQHADERFDLPSFCRCLAC